MNKETISVLVFVNTKTKETQPDYKISAKVGTEFIDCGAGWKKLSAKGTTYLSLSLDADALKQVYKDKYDKLTSAGTPVPDFSQGEKEKIAEDEFNGF